MRNDTANMFSVKFVKKRLFTPQQKLARIFFSAEIMLNWNYCNSDLINLQTIQLSEKNIENRSNFGQLVRSWSGVFVCPTPPSKHTRSTTKSLSGVETELIIALSLWLLLLLFFFFGFRQYRPVEWNVLDSSQADILSYKSVAICHVPLQVYKFFYIICKVAWFLWVVGKHRCSPA